MCQYSSLLSASPPFRLDAPNLQPKAYCRYLRKYHICFREGDRLRANFSWYSLCQSACADLSFVLSETTILSFYDPTIPLHYYTGILI